MPRRFLVGVVVAVTASICAVVAYAGSLGLSGKGTLKKAGGTSYTYAVQFNQAVTSFQIRFKPGVLVKSFTGPVGFHCGYGWLPTTNQYEIACPSGKAAADQALKGTVKLSKALSAGGASLYEAGLNKLGAKPVGPFPISGP
jgi:hypothetical protein